MYSTEFLVHDIESGVKTMVLGTHANFLGDASPNVFCMKILLSTYSQDFDNGCPALAAARLAYIYRRFASFLGMETSSRRGVQLGGVMSDFSELICMHKAIGGSNRGKSLKDYPEREIL